MLACLLFIERPQRQLELQPTLKSSHRPPPGGTDLGPRKWVESETAFLLFLRPRLLTFFPAAHCTLGERVSGLVELGLPVSH